MSFYFADTDTLSVFHTVSESCAKPELTNLSYSRRAVPASLAFGHGGVETGDGKVETRYLVLSAFLRSMDQRDAFLAALHRYDTFALVEDKPLTVRRPRYMDVSVYSITDSPDRGKRGLLESIDVTLQALDPFWYSADLTEESISLTTDHIDSSYDWKVNVGGGFATPAKLVFETTGTSNQQIKVANETDGGHGFLYEDTSNTNGQIVTVDGMTGAVTRGAVDERIALKGQFIRLLPGENHIYYWGNVVKITLNYRARWL